MDLASYLERKEEELKQKEERLRQKEEYLVQMEQELERKSRNSFPFRKRSRLTKRRKKKLKTTRSGPWPKSTAP